jgi:hypothetical protein
MAYEYDPRHGPAGPARQVPPGSVGEYEIQDGAPGGRPGLPGQVRGRWENTCKDAPPGVLCYGFVFVPDPGGTEWGPAEQKQPTPPSPGIDVQFTHELDAELPAMIRESTIEVLHEMAKQYRFNEQRADGDPWIGPSHEWKRRAEMVECELRRRGAPFHP